MAQLAHSQIHDRREGRGEREERPESSYQMSVPNELIGSVIGEISLRQYSEETIQTIYR